MLDFRDIIRDKVRTYLIKGLIILLASLVKVGLDLSEISLVLFLLLLILQDILDGEVLGILEFLLLHLQLIEHTNNLFLLASALGLARILLRHRSSPRLALRRVLDRLLLSWLLLRYGLLSLSWFRLLGRRLLLFDWLF